MKEQHQFFSKLKMATGVMLDSIMLLTQAMDDFMCHIALLFTSFHLLYGSGSLSSTIINSNS